MRTMWHVRCLCSWLSCCFAVSLPVTCMVGRRNSCAVTAVLNRVGGVHRGVEGLHGHGPPPYESDSMDESA